MCGIVGSISVQSDGNVETNLDQIQRMLATLGRRGPDDRTVYRNDQTLVGFSRLAINDPIHGGQPFVSQGGAIVAFTNGEIYNSDELKRKYLNHIQFKSESDCEVIPHLYEIFGIDFLKKLNGDFLIFILDQKENKFILAKDRFGSKPLFYKFDKDKKFIFGSELKSLWAHSPGSARINWQEVLMSESLSWELRDRGSPSFFQDVQTIDGGQYLMGHLKSPCNLIIKNYWQLEPQNRSSEEVDFKEYVSGLKELVFDSVKIRLSQVNNQALFLSSGIDSAIVGLVAKKQKAPLLTFTASCRSTRQNGDCTGAIQMAKSIGVENYQGFFEDNYVPSINDWKRLLYESETPLCGAEILYKSVLLSAAKSKFPQLKIILSGQASDEFLGGYVNRWISMAKKRSIVKDQESDLSVWSQFKQSVQLNMQGNRYRNGHFEQPADEKKLWNQLFNKSYLHETPSVQANYWDHYREIQVQNLQFWNLWLEDRVASMNSMEARAPFLDHRIAEFLQTIPIHLVEKVFNDKELLRLAFQSELGQTYCYNKKTSFFAEGDSLIHTTRMLYEILRLNKDELINQAFDLDTDNIINKDIFMSLLDGCNGKFPYRIVSGLLHIVNAFHLQYMANLSNSLKPVKKYELIDISRSN